MYCGNALSSTVILPEYRPLHRKTRNSAIPDKPRDAFRGQSRSPNMLPFHMLVMVSYLLFIYYAESYSKYNTHTQKKHQVKN